MKLQVILQSVSKQRNKQLQCVLIEAAKMTSRNSPDPALVYDKEKQKATQIEQRSLWRGS